MSKNHTFAYCLISCELGHFFPKKRAYFFLIMDLQILL